MFHQISTPLGPELLTPGTTIVKYTTTVQELDLSDVNNFAIYELLNIESDIYHLQLTENFSLQNDEHPNGPVFISKHHNELINEGLWRARFEI